MRINLNSPDGNVFQLAGIIINLMEKAGLDSTEFNHNVFKHKDYDAFVDHCKEQCKILSKILGEKIEIYESKNYEMERKNYVSSN